MKRAVSFKARSMHTLAGVFLISLLLSPAAPVRADTETSPIILQMARADIARDAGTGNPGPLARVGLDLAVAYHEYQAQPASFEPTNTLLKLDRGRVYIEAFADRSPGAADALQAGLEALGLTEAVVDHRRMTGYLPLAAVPALAALPTLSFARPVYAAPDVPREPETDETTVATDTLRAAPALFAVAAANSVDTSGCPRDYTESIAVAAGDVDGLKAAITAANASGAGVIIDLAPGTYSLTTVDNEPLLPNGTTEGPNGLPLITGRICLRGAGADTTVIERAIGAPTFRLIHVRENAEFTLVDASARNGYVDDGGAGLRNIGGSVTLRRASLRDNLADNDCDVCGSGIANTGFLRVVYSVVANNRGADDILGGGIGNGAFYGTIESQLEIKHSIISGNLSPNNDGGGILNQAGGSVTISDSTITRNTSGEDNGGGIHNAGILDITNSAITRNSSDEDDGGGISNRGTARITNSTIADNFADRSGGGIYNFGGGTLHIVNTTIAYNSAGDTGGGIDNNVNTYPDSAGGAIEIVNTLIADNDDWNAGTTPDCSGTLQSGGNNLIGNPAGCTLAPQPGDILSLDAKLAALVDDGTPGRAHVPLLGDSPAIDTGNTAACPNTDQLGQPRSDGNLDGNAVCDIGAVEFSASTRQVSIDIAPGDDRNIIFPLRRGSVWVAILTEGDFDAVQVDPETPRFGPDETAPRRYKVRDADGDGDADLLLKFKVKKTGIACGDTTATLTAATYAGQLIVGTDAIKTKGCP